MTSVGVKEEERGEIRFCFPDAVWFFTQASVSGLLHETRIVRYDWRSVAAGLGLRAYSHKFIYSLLFPLPHVHAFFASDLTEHAIEQAIHMSFKLCDMRR